MYYQPKLANGKLVKNPWPLRIVRALNHISWPLEDNASFLAHFIDRLYYIFGWILFLEHYDSELRYLYRNLQNLDDLLSGVPTTIVLFDIHLRAFQLGLFKEKLKILQKEFYANIFMEDLEEYHHIHKNIQVKMRSANFVAAFYFITFFVLASAPIMNFANNIHEPLYKMIFAFDISSPYIFYPIILTNLWVGFIVVTHLIGELYVLSQIILHLNGRFVILREDLEKSSQKLLNEAKPSTIAKDFQLEIIKIINRNTYLYKFASKVQAEISYRVFVWFSLSAALLCALGYKAYTSPRESISFIFWAAVKIVELSSIGDYGSTLRKTTDEVSSMYYHSNWEQIIVRSTNTSENIRLMKLLLLAMETSHKPIQISGLKFFNVSLSTVIAILQGAGSYFTCLISLR